MLYRLEEPSIQYKDTYISFINEFVSKGEDLIPFPLGFPHNDFNLLLERLSNESKGIGLAAGHVPHSSYWLINESGKLVGVANLRHELNPTLLRKGGNIGYGVCPSERGKGLGTLLLGETLKKAQNLGLEKVLIICKKENTASAKVIINNGGLFYNEEFIPEMNEILQRYWIQMQPA